MKIAHLADTHLGYRRRVAGEPAGSPSVLRAQDVRDAFSDAIDKIIALAPDLFVHAGDVFDRARPSLEDLLLVVDAARRLTRAGIPQVWIAGNHDATRAPAGLDPFDALHRLIGGDNAVFVPAGVGSFNMTMGGAVVHAIGWDAQFDPAALTLLHDPSRPVVVVGHGTLVDGVLSMGRESVDLRPFAAAYVALGHLHVRPPVPAPCFYAGSTERYGWRDYFGDPGFNVVTLAPSSRGHRVAVDRRIVKARPMVDLGTWLFRECGGMDAELELHRLPAGALARVLVSDAPRWEWGSVRRNLAALANGWCHLQVDLLEPGREARRRPLAVVDSTRLDVLGAFEDFLGTLEEHSAEFMDRLRDRGRSALIEAEAALRAEEEARG